MGVLQEKRRADSVRRIDRGALVLGLAVSITLIVLAVLDEMQAAVTGRRQSLELFLAGIVLGPLIFATIKYGGRLLVRLTIRNGH